MEDGRKEAHPDRIPSVRYLPFVDSVVIPGVVSAFFMLFIRILGKWPRYISIPYVFK